MPIYFDDSKSVRILFLSQCLLFYNYTQQLVSKTHNKQLSISLLVAILIFFIQVIKIFANEVISHYKR